MIVEKVVAIQIYIDDLLQETCHKENETVHRILPSQTIKRNNKKELKFKVKSWFLVFSVRKNLLKAAIHNLIKLNVKISRYNHTP
jgi:hypothetical protein